MRTALYVLAAVGALSAVDIAPAAAYDYPVCMRTRFGNDDCSYSNYAQCAATASGLGQTCFQNPALSYAQTYDPQPYPRRKIRARRTY